MEIIILPVPCCSDTCNGFGRESRKTRAKPWYVSKNLKAARCEDARFPRSSEGGVCTGWDWSSSPLEEGVLGVSDAGSAPEEADLFKANRSLALPLFGWGSLQTTQTQRQ